MSAGLGNETLVFVDLETGGLEPSRPIPSRRVESESRKQQPMS